MSGAARRALLSAATVLLTAAPAFAESLADSMVAAYRHSALLEQNRAVLRAADEDVAGAMAQLRPVIQWTLSHEFRSVNGAETNQTSLSLVGQLTLYDWGRSQLGIDIAKETVLATRESLVAVEQDVLLTATSAYLDVISAQQQVSLQQNSVDLLGQEQQAARDRFDVGEITSTDVSLADAQLAATRAQLAAAQGQLEIARENFEAATGKAPVSLAPPPALPKLPKSVEAAQATAQKKHPAILQAQRSTAASELQVAAAAAERLPLLTGNASVGAARSPNQLTGSTHTNDIASLSLNMSQTIYSGGRLPSAHRRAMAARDASRSSLLNVARQVNQSVGIAWANISVAGAQIKAIDQQITAAQQAYNGVREEATLGARTTLDVLDAEQNLLEARANKITAVSNLQLAHYQLLAAMGLLTVEDLKLGIPTYDPSAYYSAVRNAPYTSVQGKNLDRVLRAIGK